LAEVFANKISTTVASGYTAGSGTLVVASATGMPATGNFRIRLGNSAGSILRVTARAGTTLTVDVEQDDGNASIGDTVRIINTAAAMEALKADAIAAGGGGGFPWWPTIVRPDTIAWTWQNQGAASVVDANKVSFVTVPSSGTSVRSRLISAPATPYTVTALIRSNATSAGQQYCGPVFRESGTGKLYIFYLLINGTLQATKFTNDTTFSAVGAVNTTGPIVTADWTFYRIADNGVNLSFSISTDGQNFFALGSEGRTVFMAGGPNQIGFFANTDGSPGSFSMSCASFAVT